MKTVEHLEIYDLTLTVRSPLHIGSGQSFQATEYLFDFSSGQASIINRDALCSFIAENGFADQYEAFIMSGSKNLKSFLGKTCGLSSHEMKKLCLYSVDARSALDKDHSLKEIYSFVRNSRNEVYVPGSSVKGALRTVLLFSMIQNDDCRCKDTEIPENRYLNTLQLGKEKKVDSGNAVTSILRGLQISDSVPLGNDHISLASKMDVSVDGDVNKINLCRETIIPGTKLQFRLTLDRSILPQSITVETILNSIADYSDYYYDQYVKKFGYPERDCGEQYEDCLILGGGAGFFSKTLSYPYYGDKKGLEEVSSFMMRKFKNHKHTKDVERGISPHMLKYTEYEGKLYPFGVCGVEIQ